MTMAEVEVSYVLYDELHLNIACYIIYILYSMLYTMLYPMKTCYITRVKN